MHHGRLCATVTQAKALTQILFLFLWFVDDESVRRTMTRELKLLRQLKHDNIVNLIEAFRRRGKVGGGLVCQDHAQLTHMCLAAAPAVFGFRRALFGIFSCRDLTCPFPVHAAALPRLRVCRPHHAGTVGRVSRWCLI